MAKIEPTAWKVLNVEVRSMQIRLLEALEDQSSEVAAALERFGLMVAGSGPVSGVPILSVGPGFWEHVYRLKQESWQRARAG